MAPRSPTGSQRIKLVDYLAQHVHREDALAALAACLGDSAKGVRERARAALLGAETERVLAVLSEHLGAKRKAERIEAARTLAALPPSQRGYELAQQRLEEERTADVKDLLAKIEEPVEGEVLEDRDLLSGQAREEAIAALTESKRLLELGPE